MEDWVLTAVSCLFQATIKQIIVLVNESDNGVSNFSGIVQHPKLVAVDGLSPLIVQHFVSDEVFVLSNCLDELR